MSIELLPPNRLTDPITSEQILFGTIHSGHILAKCLHCVRTACALRAHCVGTACALRAHCSETHPMPPLYDTAKQQSQQDTH